MGERGRGGEEGRGDGDQERVCVRWCCWIEKQGSTSLGAGLGLGIRFRVCWIEKQGSVLLD